MATQEFKTNETAGEESWLVPGPCLKLMDLPYATRWEVTRRHPYFLRFWQLAQRHYTTPSTDPEQRGLEESAALLLLGMLGVTTAPPDPGSSAESLMGGTLFKAWEAGAVAPVPLRTLAAQLLTDVPRDALERVGRLFVQCAGQAEQKHEKFPFLQELLSLPSPALDSISKRPVVGINLEAPLRTITEGVENMVRGWKKQEGIEERRRRDDKLEDYLAVWDLREGWVKDQYHGSKEQTLREIAQQLHISLSTVANRYRSGFQLVIGHEYTSALWARVIGFFKARACLGPHDLPRRTLHRPWRDRQRRAVPEAALAAPGVGAAGAMNVLAVSRDDLACTNLVLDIQELLERGRSDAEIVALLDLTSR